MGVGWAGQGARAQWALRAAPPLPLGARPRPTLGPRGPRGSSAGRDPALRWRCGRAPASGRGPNRGAGRCAAPLPSPQPAPGSGLARPSSARPPEPSNQDREEEALFRPGKVVIVGRPALRTKERLRIYEPAPRRAEGDIWLRVLRRGRGPSSEDKGGAGPARPQRGGPVAPPPGGRGRRRPAGAPPAPRAGRPPPPPGSPPSLPCSSSAAERREEASGEFPLSQLCFGE